MRTAGLISPTIKVGFVVSACFLCGWQTPAAPASAFQTLEKSKSFQTERVGSKACSVYNSKLYGEYCEIAMGRSVVAAEETNQLAPSTPVTIGAGHETFEVIRRGHSI